MSKQLNFMLLVGEDTGRQHRCYGNEVATTPNIDRLASEGCRYTHAFTHSPVCAPSRSGLVAGRYPWAIGTHLMRCTLRTPPRLFTHELIDAGYEVHWPTKTDFNFNPPADFAVTTPNWLQEGRIPEPPFFLYQNFEVTHESSVWDTPNWANQTYATRARDLPPQRRHDPARVKVPAYLPDVPEVRLEIARHLDMLLLQDEGIGRALQLLEASGHADNTVVIYLTDHGRGLPREKRWCYDAGLRLPLIVRWPGHIAPGSICDDLVGWVDLAPTILSLAGVPVPPHYDGQVFLGRAAAPPRDYCYAGRDRMDEAFDRVRVVRSQRYHYVRNYFPTIPYFQRNQYMEQGRTTQALRRARREGTLTDPQRSFVCERKPVEELYEPETDPDMVRNLAGSEAHRAALLEHRAALDRFQQRVPDLGATTEEELVASGLITDRLEEYRGRIKPLPEEDRITDDPAVLTLREAIAVHGPPATV